MKTTFLSALLVLAAGVASATGFGMAVGTGTSVKVAPERGTVYLTPWTNGTAVAQGQLFSYQQGAYLATTGMTSSVTAPSADINFRVLRSNKPRNVLVLCNTGSSALWLGIGAPAAVNTGIKLLAETTIAISDINAAVFAVADGPGGYIVGTDLTGN